LREVLDRTEGKVADVLITGNIGELVKALEAGKEGLVAARQPQPAIEGEVITPQPIVVAGEVVSSENPHPEPIPTNSTPST
jgi:hypothetical protein